MAQPLVDVVHGDALEQLRLLPATSVDAVITDPPYELGFMGKSWDAAGIAYSVELWAECLRVLRPGGHLAAFGGSRTYHRMACAVEDAGFEIRDSLQWIYGSGFPKSRDVSKAIDQRAPRAGMFEAFAAHFWDRWQASGLRRVDFVPHFPHYKNAESVMAQLSNWKLAKNVPSVQDYEILRGLLGLSGDWSTLIERVEAERKVIGSDRNWGRASESAPNAPNGEWNITAPATDAARTWAGWGTALKPAVEPIVLARKPFPGSVAANTLAHGVGGLNIDATRVGSEVRTRIPRGIRPGHDNYVGDDWRPDQVAPKEYAGRWPSNILLTHSPECDGVCVAGCPVAELDAQSGVGTSTPYRWQPHHQPGPQSAMNASADGSFRTPPDGGYSDSGGASRFFPTFRYQAKAPTSERPKVDGVSHPTVKPLALMRWLVRLLCPPDGLVLEPFAGSGTTIEACIDEGMSVIGIEREAEYLPHIQVRIDRARARQTPPPAGDSLALFEVG